MKSSFWQHTLATLALVVALPTAVFAQAADPAVVNDNNVVVTDGAAAADFLLTDFPDTLVNGTSEADFSIINNGDADLQISYISVPAGFASTLAVPATVTAGNEVSFKVSFTPTAAATFSGDVEIGTNAPDAESTYTFGVTGTGVNEITTVKNIAITWAEKKGVIAPLKVKLNKKTGGYKITGSAVVANPGLVEISSANVEIWYSADEFLSADDTSLGQLKKPISKLKAFDPVKNKLKVKKAKIAVEAPAATGFIFLKAYTTLPAGEEVTQLDNVVNLGF